MTRPVDILPISLAPRGLSRVQAAAYINTSPTLFDAMVADGRMPPPKHVNARRIWDRVRVDEAFAALPDDDDAHEIEGDPLMEALNDSTA